MAEPFIAEVRMMSFDFAPKGWAFCNGQLLPINQNQALFSLLGTTFGGNGQTTFALPNLQGRVPIHTGGQGGHVLGETGGEQNHTLTIPEIPRHMHVVTAASSDGAASSPNGNLLARAAPANPYIAPTNLGALQDATLAYVGGGQAHTNLQPFLTINFCIAQQGIFPSRN